MGRCDTWDRHRSPARRGAIRAPSRTPSSGIVDGICEITLEARDAEALASFYDEILGCGRISREEERIWLSCGSHARLGIWALGKKEFGDRGGRHVHFALSCAPKSLDAFAGRLRRLGVAHRDPMEHPGGDRSIYVEDPEGNVVEVWDFFRQGEGARDGVEALGEAPRTGS